MATKQVSPMMTHNVITSLDLMKVRKEQRRVCALLQGDSDSMLSNRQRKMIWFPNETAKGKTRPERKWATHLTTTDAITSPSSNNFDRFRNDADANRTLQMERMCDNDKPATLLPSIEPRRTFHKRSSQKESKVDSEREVCYLENSNVTRRSQKASRDSTKKYEIKENDLDEIIVGNTRTSKPITVKYNHQKVNPSIEELWRRYREELLDGRHASKTTVTDIGGNEARRRSDYSNLSSISNISALRRQLAETGDNYLQALTSDRVNSSNTVRDDAAAAAVAAATAAAAAAAATAAAAVEKDGHSGHRPYPSLDEDLVESLSEEELKNCLADNDTCAAQSSPVASRDVDTFVNNPNRLPDIRIYWQPQVTFEPEVRKWTPHIGETTRPFVFSYFDRLPLLDRSRDSDDWRKSKSSKQTKSKTKRK